MAFFGLMTKSAHRASLAEKAEARKAQALANLKQNKARAAQGAA